MRLINVKTLELKEFYDDPPPYAILSHTWEKEEVTLQEYENATSRAAAVHGKLFERAQLVKAKSGFRKIVGACKQTVRLDLQWLWCDTNCIDKTNPTELSEAINSMYAWYYNSKVCVVFLADVEGILDESFEKSRWWTRGWTLQELIAPTEVRFYNSGWNFIGDRKTRASDISKITRIHIEALSDRNTVPKFSIAQRMSWASDRVTSRQEDIAYCLLGIFDINMPLLYGEKERAFFRLQQEIIKVSDDQSILAWDLEESHVNDSEAAKCVRALALTPSMFRYCGSIIRDDELGASPFSVTNLGISLKIPLMETLSPRTVFARLNCSRELRGWNAASDDTSLGSRIRLHVWIALHYNGNRDYFRVHAPVPKIHPADYYEDKIQKPSTHIFLQIDASHSRRPMYLTEHLGVPFPTNNLSGTSGIVVSIGSGRVMPVSRLVADAYRLGQIKNVFLRRQGSSTLSHQLVASGTYVIIVSVYWDERGLPQDLESTIFVDRNFEHISHMALQPKWACLFEAGQHQHPQRCCTSMVSLRLLHERLKECQWAISRNSAGEDMRPLVSLDRSRYRSLLGRPEVHVQVIFREKCQK
ncbi:HET-domain-containing protein [Xylariaceae sp. FL1019]|nr:HET-domain-containing protein [Xylariaceae sp. FL1019]